MSGADDLRTELRVIVAQTLHAACGYPLSAKTHFAMADAVLDNVIAVPERRLAILTLIGDVSKATPRWSEFAGNDVLDVEAWPDMDRNADYYVVRPHGEAT